MAQYRSEWVTEPTSWLWTVPSVTTLMGLQTLREPHEASYKTEYIEIWLGHLTVRFYFIFFSFFFSVLKRSKPALLGLSSPAISDLDDDPTVAEDLVSNKTCMSEVIEIDSDRDELEKELGKCSLIILSHCCSYSFLAAAQKTWRSPIYGFFKPNIAIEIHKGCVLHFFQCAVKRCKTEARGV